MMSRIELPLRKTGKLLADRSLVQQTVKTENGKWEIRMGNGKWEMENGSGMRPNASRTHFPFPIFHFPFSHFAVRLIRNLQIQHFDRRVEHRVFAAERVQSFGLHHLVGDALWLCG